MNKLKNIPILKDIVEFLYRNTIFRAEFNKFLKLSKNEDRFKISWSDKHPCLFDKTTNTEFDKHYIYHTSWAARKLRQINPEKHIDIGSSLFFSTIISSFFETEYYDIRPANIILNNFHPRKGNLLSLPFKSNSVLSLSCMHVIEHIGLGRYGDKLAPRDDIKAINELKRVMKKNGNLLFVVPIGLPKIQFNAHRIYSHEQILNYFKDFQIIEFALISDDPEVNGIIINPSNSILKKQKYGCGCYWLRK